jgi:NAD(P)-dependent dehydrogenase (short-subunit alcohol dehydrogenase family)
VGRSERQGHGPAHDRPCALVAGGGSVIGAACARELAGLGARVAVADLSPEAAKPVAAELGEDGFSVTADVTAAAAVAAMVQQFGRLEIAVTSASVGMPVKALADTELAE